MVTFYWDTLYTRTFKSEALSDPGYEFAINTMWF